MNTNTHRYFKKVFMDTFKFFVKCFFYLKIDRTDFHVLLYIFYTTFFSGTLKYSTVLLVDVFDFQLSIFTLKKNIYYFKHSQFSILILIS